MVIARPKSWCKVVRFPTQLSSVLRGGVGTIGNFDGLHTGHREIITAMHSVKAAAPRVVVSFYPHPTSVIQQTSNIPLISGLREKAALLSHADVQLLYLLHFTKRLAQMSATDFIHKVFVQRLGLSHLVVGEDAAIGKGREGNVHFLRENLAHHGIGLTVVPHLCLDGVRPSSRSIRELLAEGRVETAATLLGRFHAVVGRVAHGDGRGSKIGFPTANLSLGQRLIPRVGVYACLASVSGKTFPAVTNIGTRPTFDGGGIRVEVHVMNSDGSPAPLEMYGQRLTVSFVARVRDELKFPSVGDLVVQIRRDARVALELVAPHVG